MKSNNGEILYVASIAPQAASATVTGSGVDVSSGNAASVLFNVGVTGGTLTETNNITLSVQASDDNSAYVDVDASELVGTLPVIASNDDDNVVVSVGYIGKAHYLKAVATYGGTHSAATPIAAGVVLTDLFQGK